MLGIFECWDDIFDRVRTGRKYHVQFRAWRKEFQYNEEDTRGEEKSTGFYTAPEP